MLATDLHINESEIEKVVRWRAERLECAGYERGAALEIASRVEIDLHHAVGLLERGCTPQVAARILL
jgi:hypothetical protein